MGFIEIVARRLDGGFAHADVTELVCEDREGVRAIWTPAQVVAWLDTVTNVAMVYAEGRRTRFVVGVDGRREGRPHLRTYTQDGWTDHLLALPDIPLSSRTARDTTPSAGEQVA
jgi:hypothetical protein